MKSRLTLWYNVVPTRERDVFVPNLLKCPLCLLAAHKATYARKGHLFLIHTRALCGLAVPYL